MNKKNLLILPFAVLLLTSCGGEQTSSSEATSVTTPMKDAETIVLPDVFKGHNFAYAGVEPGVALIFDENNNPEIQNATPYLDFYDIQFEAKPLTKKETKDGTMYFLAFKVTDQFIDDGYLKNDIEYKFWLSYNETKFYCGLSKDDPTLTEPDIVLMADVL